MVMSTAMWSRARLLQMLDKEFTQVVQRLADKRPKNTTVLRPAPPSPRAA